MKIGEGCGILCDLPVVKCQDSRYTQSRAASSVWYRSRIISRQAINNNMIYVTNIYTYDQQERPNTTQHIPSFCLGMHVDWHNSCGSTNVNRLIPYGSTNTHCCCATLAVPNRYYCCSSHNKTQQQVLYTQQLLPSFPGVIQEYNNSRSRSMILTAVHYFVVPVNCLNTWYR